MDATRRRPTSPGQSSPDLSLFESLLRPLEAALDGIPDVLEEADKRYRKFFARAHLRALLYFHFAHLPSGRALVRALKTEPRLREIVGWPDIHLTSVADAHGSRDLAFVEAALQAVARTALPRVRHRLPPRLRAVRAVDSTFIGAVASMVWARYREGERGVRLHTVFDPDQRLPDGLILRAGASDERAAAERLLKPGLTYIFDRGYPSVRLLRAVEKKQAFYICRLPVGAPVLRLGTRTGDRSAAIVEDSIVQYAPESSDPVTARLVVVRREREEDLWVLTNRWDLSADEIAVLYRERWSIEFFFRWLKADGADEHWIGRSRHAVLLQVLTKFLSYLLSLLVLHARTLAVELPIAFREAVQRNLLMPLRVARRALRAAWALADSS